VVKANGRSRWRAWAKKLRAKDGPLVFGAYLKRHNNKGYAVPRSLDSWRPLPVRLFAPRSLVGMTQGARKRRARVEAENRKRLQVGGTEPTGKGAALWLIDRRFILATWRGPRWAAEQYSQMRTKYRIGERSRACPGCPDCVPSMQDHAIEGRWIEGEAVRHHDRCSHDDPSGYCCFAMVVKVAGKCNGAGVLPAGAGR
jgi:hypothetical protein